MAESLPYVGLGPCAFCGHPDAGHRVRDGLAERYQAGETLEELAYDYGLEVDQARALIAMAEAESDNPQEAPSQRAHNSDASGAGQPSYVPFAGAAESDTADRKSVV